MPLLPALVLLSLLVPAAARAAPLFCYWVESSYTATAGRALGQDGRIREVGSDGRVPADQVAQSLEIAAPLGNAIPPELMERLRTLAAAALKGPYRDTAGTRSSWMAPHQTVACVVPGPGRRLATVILRECHNSTHINVAATAPELMSHLLKLITISPVRSGPVDVQALRDVLAPCS